jgi:hypothetical protein
MQIISADDHMAFFKHGSRGRLGLPVTMARCKRGVEILFNKLACHLWRYWYSQRGSREVILYGSLLVQSAHSNQRGGSSSGPEEGGLRNTGIIHSTLGLAGAFRRRSGGAFRWK